MDEERVASDGDKGEDRAARRGEKSAYGPGDLEPVAKEGAEVASPGGGGESKWLLILLAVAAGGLGALYVGTKIAAEVGTDEGGGGPPVIVVESTTTHKVTPEMERDSEAKAGVAAPAFRAKGTDGEVYSAQEGASQEPLVLVFIKDGCPCSESAQPFYNQLARLYGEKARFLGVINGDGEVAARWGKANEVAFPILADPEQTIIRDYQARNSAYVALVREGRIERLWPGYSTGMLQEAGAMLADLTGRPEEPLDLLDAPTEPYSGCPYEVEWEEEEEGGAVDGDRGVTEEGAAVSEVGEKN